MGVHVDVGTWWTIVLSPGQTQTWWFTWGFDSNHWLRFVATPDSDNSKIQILAQWAQKDLHGGVSRWVTWKNNGTTDVAFKPRCLVAPSR